MSIVKRAMNLFLLLLICASFISTPAPAILSTSKRCLTGAISISA